VTPGVVTQCCSQKGAEHNRKTSTAKDITEQTLNNEGALGCIGKILLLGNLPLSLL
jgi:hypothetical protein